MNSLCEEQTVDCDVIRNITIKTLKGGGTFEFKGHTDSLEPYHELLRIFASTSAQDDKNTIKGLYQLTKQVKHLVLAYAKHYAQANVKFHKMRQLFKALDDNEYIIVHFDENPFLHEDENYPYMILEAFNNNIPLEKIVAQYTKAFAGLNLHYDKTYALGKKNSYFGEIEKGKRICRFCGRKKPEVEFSKKAHTISEALGNKTIITYDECDDCNERFGNGIERTLIEYLNIFRTIFFIPGKSGVPATTGKNFKILADQQNKHIIFEYEGLELSKDAMPQTMTLEANNPIVPQDIYRCLCKYVIGTISENNLAQFKKTIEWINKEFDFPHLPRVAEKFTDHFFDSQPKLTVYTRKSNEKHLPYAVCEFHFACLIFVFIIPTDGDFGEDQRELLTNFFNIAHVGQTVGWLYRDFSLTKPISLQMSITFEKDFTTP